MKPLRDTGQLHRVVAANTRLANAGGSVAAEFALVAPLLILLATAIVDLGLLADKSAELAAATRIGAELARNYPDDAGAIQNAVRGAMTFVPPLTFPASFPRSCECGDGEPIACSDACATVGRPPPNRVFIRITANQAFTPLLPWPGLPALLSAAAEVRLQ